MKWLQKEIFRGLSKKDMRNLSLAKNLAKSSMCNQRHGAVIVKGGSVISTGINKFRNHPENVQPEFIKTSCSVHAEVDAIRKVSNLKGATIYVARVNKKNQDALSRPCDNCWAEIRKAGIRKVVHT
jgi:deoxycytidylate deaminase